MFQIGFLVIPLNKIFDGSDCSLPLILRLPALEKELLAKSKWRRPLLAEQEQPFSCKVKQSSYDLQKQCFSTIPVYVFQLDSKKSIDSRAHMQRLRSSGTSIFRKVGAPNLRRQALNSWSAVQDTYFSTKDVFERHKVVFTIGTSIASVATAWAGYSIRYYHQTKVDERLDSIEKAVKSKHVIEHDEIKKIVAKGNVSTAACIATAGTALLIGYGFGWRGGLWYANRRLRREQMKLLGQIKPRKWQLKFLRRPLGRLRGSSDGATTVTKDTASLSSSVVNG